MTPAYTRRAAAAALPLLLASGLAGCAPDLGAPDTGTVDRDALQWVWGDLHAHSGWSFDGCEEPDHACTHAGTLPAEQFMQAAIDARLDFAALTDHAEADTYQWAADELHAEGGEADIWEGQRAVLKAADGGPVLPILGYEWTNNALEEDDYEGPGSHRTILLEDLDACRAYRIAGRAFPEGVKEAEQGERSYLQDQVEVQRNPLRLWAGLEAAGLREGCTPVRWISFAHHPAYRVPQYTNWAAADNAPVVEPVVEIYSEHGSSECQGPTSEGCDWQINEAQTYSVKGAVQTALNLHYRLGFVGGTDAHDAHPGSLADGPSHIAQWNEGEEAPIVHFGPGGLTGALVEGELDRPALFDAIEARRTVATSGPRPELWAWAEGRSGRVYLPGAVVPRADLPARIVLELDGLDPDGTLSEEQVAGLVVDQLLASHSIFASEAFDSTVGVRFEGEWDPAAGDTWTYLRLRWTRASGEGLDEERVWVSPWFTDEATGCQAAPAAPGLVLALLPALLLRRRRR